MACGQCQDGWLITERNGLSGAERCACSIPLKANLVRPTPEKIMAVVVALSRLIPFFPCDEISLKLIAGEVHRFCDDAERLQHFAQEAARYFTKWQGIGPMRALYCAMFRPADGLYAQTIFQDAEGRTQVGIAGYTEEELLARHCAHGERERTKEFERFERLAIGQGCEPVALPEVKRIA